MAHIILFYVSLKLSLVSWLNCKAPGEHLHSLNWQLEPLGGIFLLGGVFLDYNSNLFKPWQGIQTPEKFCHCAISAELSLTKGGSKASLWSRLINGLNGNA
jgi:hypothetical protein